MLRNANRPVLAYFDAIKALRVRQVGLVLKAGFDPNLLVNAHGQNGLQFMISYFGATEARFRLEALPLNKTAYLAMAKLLLDSGLDPNMADILTGETAIFDAIRCNDKEMVALLLNYADLSVRNKNGETALMCAARFGSKQVMRLILEHLRQLEIDGYFLRQRNRFGLTALELARAENLECAKVLTKHLIAHGHHATHAVLARSASHHQLLAGREALVAPYLRTACTNALADPESDYESDMLGVPYRPKPMRPPVSYRAAPSSGYFDSKAAEFNQYLLEQHELGQSGERASSEEDEAYLAPSSSGGLTRSRSCILAAPSGSSKQQQQQQQLANKMAASSLRKGPLDGGSKGAGSSWDLSGVGRNTAS